MKAKANIENEKPTLDEQYHRLIEARNFHYTNFNTWLRFFYALIGALLVAFYTIATKSPNHLMELALAIIGYVISLACLLSCKGYYYWEYKWIERLQHFEKNVWGLKNSDLQVYSAFVNKRQHDKPASLFDGASVSTTKVALVLTFIITVSWGALVTYLVMNSCTSLCPCCATFTAISVSIIASYILMIVGSLAFPSNLDGIDEIEK